MELGDQVARDTVLRLLRFRRVPEANFVFHVVKAAQPVRVTREQAVNALSALVKSGEVVTEGHFLRLARR